MTTKFLRILVLVPLALSIAAQAVPSPTTSGTFKGSTWTASSLVVGVTSTATIAGGGNPIYLAPKSRYNGVVSIIMDKGAAGKFICSGTLLPCRQSVLTAGHCVSSGAGTLHPITTTVYFNNGSADTQTFLDPTSVAITVKQYHVNPLYTGEVIDQNDIAVLRLSAPAPAFAKSYGLFTGGDLTGLNYNIAGYGARSDKGGSVGTTPPDGLGVGRLRQGNNRYEFRYGDPGFGGFFAGKPVGGFFGTADNTYTYISDFDNGLAANDASCKLGGAFGLGGSQFCNLGRGAREVSTAGGDSGGPQFINGQIASITSFGQSYGPMFGDVDTKLNSSFGELNGFVPTFIHAAFIGSVIPEPASWMMMIAGFGLIGVNVRRTRSKTAAV